MTNYSIILTFLLIFSNLSWGGTHRVDNFYIEIPEDWKTIPNYAKSVKLLTRSPKAKNVSSRAAVVIQKHSKKITKVDKKQAQLNDNIFKAKWEVQSKITALNLEPFDYKKQNENFAYSMHEASYKFKNSFYNVKTFVVQCYSDVYTIEIMGKEIVKDYFNQADQFIRKLRCIK